MEANLSLLKELQRYLVSGDARRSYYIVKAAQFTLFLLPSSIFFFLFPIPSPAFHVAETHEEADLHSVKC